jgi:hypothetical protein
MFNFFPQKSWYILSLSFRDDIGTILKKRLPIWHPVWLPLGIVVPNWLEHETTDKKIKYAVWTGSLQELSMDDLKYTIIDQ